MMLAVNAEYGAAVKDRSRIEERVAIALGEADDGRHAGAR